MAIGTTAAIIGGAALGVGGSVLSSRSQSRAAQTAADASQASTTQQVNLARDIFNQQRDDLAPARDFQQQQMNGLGEVFGFNPVGDAANANSAPTFNQSVASGRGGQGFDVSDFGGRFAGRSGIARDFRDLPPLQDLGSVRGQSPQIYTQPDGRAYAGGQNAIVAANQPEQTVMESQQNAARERFEGSMFNDVYRQGHERDVDRIDAGLGAQGLAFSGARLQAVEDARADRFGSTFNNYLSAMMGQAPQSATNATNAAAGQYGAAAGGAIAQNGQNQQQSAYAQGQAGSNLWGGISQLGGFAAGGGFGG